MASQQPPKPPAEDTRRHFIRGSSMLLASALPVGGTTAAAGSNNRPLRVGLVGCGRRGVAIASEALNGRGGEIEIAALADVFSDRVQQAFRTLKGRSPQSVAVQPEARFIGLDAYRRLMDCPLDLVILATPPFFRPLHFAAAVYHGKHVFSEKPIAVDAPGVREFLDSGKQAAALGLCVAIGKHRHYDSPHQNLRLRDLVDQLRIGIIGDIVEIRWTAGSETSRTSKTTLVHHGSELEHQLRHWQRFDWLGGSPMLEQQIHLLDLANDLVGSPPLVAAPVTPRNDSSALDGVATPEVRYCYAGGQQVFSSCCPAQLGSKPKFQILGTRGRCDLISRRAFDNANRPISLSSLGQAERPTGLDELIAAIRSGQRLNECSSAAESTLAAIMGQRALDTSLPQTWSECFRSDLSISAFDALHCKPK